MIFRRGSERLLSLLALATAILVSAGCSSSRQEADNEGAAPVLAVGERELGRPEFERYLLREVGVQAGTIDAQAEKELYEEFYAEVLLARAAERAGFEVDAAALNAEVARLEGLEPAGSAEELEREARRRLLAQLYLEQVLAAEITIEPEEVDARLGRPERHRRRDLIVYRQIAVAGEKEAKAVYRRVVRGKEPFDAVARELSLTPDRGAIQQVPLEGLPDPVADVLERLPEGKISRPVKVGDLVYLFQVDARNRERDPGRVRQRQEVEQRLLTEKLESLRRQRLVQLAEEEGVRAPALPAPPEEP
ncbi:MAG: peptidyl-prolyl cis-trans isomerase [Acidobacteriota bacterium]|nr:peptidyl-prolyl cis-trans isomerase [Acidobacteriota bacterium]